MPTSSTLAPGLLRGLGHLRQVVLGHGQRQAAQGVVAAQLDAPRCRACAASSRARQPRAAAGRRVAADAGVDDRGAQIFRAASRFSSSGHPAGAALQAILGTERVAEHQDRLPACGHAPARHNSQLTPAAIKWRRFQLPTSMSDPIISVEHVHKSVTDSTGTLDILRDIDFTLAPRETAAIVGASGSGKSTLLSIIAGLDTPTPRHRAAGGPGPVRASTRTSAPRCGPGRWASCSRASSCWAT